MNLSELQDFLNQNEIPSIKGKPKTFLEITKQPHYENVWSNIYAFYLDYNGVHKLKDLFIKCLLEIINASPLAKNNLVFDSFSNYKITTEYSTINQKRIDIVLQNKDYAIIIENKVRHHLNNDLNEYFNEINVSEKVGVVLSLHPISDISHKRFINITHLEFVNKILQNLGSYLLNGNEKYIVFLKDFCQNIINLSHPIMEKDNIEFYYKNQERINHLVSFKYKLREHIVEQVKDAGNRLEEVSKYEPRVNSFNDNRLVYYVSKKNKNLMITVVYEDLLKSDKMYIAVEMQGDLLRNRTDYNQIEFTPAESEIAFSDNFKNTSYTWAHFAVIHYHPTVTEIANLSQFIIDKLRNDNLLAIFLKLEAFISKNE